MESRPRCEGYSKTGAGRGVALACAAFANGRWTLFRGFGRHRAAFLLCWWLHLAGAVCCAAGATGCWPADRDAGPLRFCVTARIGVPDRVSAACSALRRLAGATPFTRGCLHPPSRGCGIAGRVMTQLQPFAGSGWSALVREPGSASLGTCLGRSWYSTRTDWGAPHFSMYQRLSQFAR